MGFAIKYTTEKTGVSSKSVKRIVKEKLTGPLRDNKSLRKRLTNDEKLSDEEIEKIRKLVHEEFAKFQKRPGKRVSSDARYPTIGNLQKKSHSTLWAKRAMITFWVELQMTKMDNSAATTAVKKDDDWGKKPKLLWHFPPFFCPI